MIVFVALGALAAGQDQLVAQSPAISNRKPNVVYFLVDNLGIGELSSYSGGPFRGATTKRTDDFAKQGMMLVNFAPEGTDFGNLLDYIKEFGVFDNTTLISTPAGYTNLRTAIALTGILSHSAGASHLMRV